MSFIDLFNSGFKQRNRDHFAAIVRVAMGDGEIHPTEKNFLDQLAKQLDISEASYHSILKNYNQYPINPPTLYEQRVERLYDLARMVYVDAIKDENEVKLLTKIAVGLGFSTSNVDAIVQKALSSVMNGTDFENFKLHIKHFKNSKE